MDTKSAPKNGWILDFSNFNYYKYIHFKNGKIHNTLLPAVVWKDTNRDWFQYGKLIKRAFNHNGKVYVEINHTVTYEE